VESLSTIKKNCANHRLHIIMRVEFFSSRMAFAPARLDVDPSIIDSNLMMVNFLQWRL
jgi:hypothetical protein